MNLDSGDYKNFNDSKINMIAELSPSKTFKAESCENEENLIDIINELSQDSIADEQLSILEQKLNEFPQSLIPCDLPPKYISKIFNKFQNTANPLEEKCLILLIECFSMIDNYFPIFNDLDLFHIVFNKISDSSPNNLLMIKVLANIFDSLENKEDSLNSICSLFKSLLTNEDYQIYDFLIQFIYNYSNDECATESGCNLISDSLLSLFENCQKKSLTISTFSIERIFWILKSLISKFDHDFSLIVNHPVIQNKHVYLYNSKIEVTMAYITLSGLLFSKNLNPFDLHIFDFIPFLKSQNKSIISPTIWIMSIMVECSQEMADEMKGLNLSIFEDVYSDIEFNVKIEIAYLYHHLINKLSNDQYYDFFIENANILCNFLELENQIIIAHTIMFISVLQSLLIGEGNDSKIDNFVSILMNNDFRDLLDYLIEEGIFTFLN